MPIAWLSGSPPGLDEPTEMHQTYSEQWSDDKLSADVQLKCAWSQRTGILNNILTTPLEWPYQPGNGIYAISGTIRPFTGEPGTADGSGYTWTDALINVHFETLSVGNDPGGGDGTVIYSESIEPTAEFLTIPHTDFRWGSSAGAALKQEEAPGRLEIGLDYVVTLYKMTSVPAWVLTLVNKVNNASVVSASLGVTFAAGTLLFNPPKISRSISLGGSSAYTISTRYTYKASGWNYFYRAESGTYVQMYHKDSGGTPYLNFATADFSGAIP